MSRQPIASNPIKQALVEYQRRYRVGPIRLAISVLILTLAFWLWAMLITGSLKAEEVISNSMAPTVARGDRLIVRQFSDRDEIRRGMIVVVQPAEPDGLPSLKRVVAIPGDFVRVVGNRYFVNYEPNEVELRSLGLSPTRGSMRYDLGPDQYFVAGDNREVSLDSVQLGPVPRSRLSALAIFRYAPLGKLGKIS